MDIERIASVAAGEAVRQQTDFDGYVRLLEAYKFGYDFRTSLLNTNYIYSLATIIEPSKNTFGHYRHTPVTFANVGYAVDAGLVPTAMVQWFRLVNDVTSEGDKDWCVKEFLNIHPFSDGNGRLAWIVRTRLYDNWDSPEPLPKYFPGE